MHRPLLQNAFRRPLCPKFLLAVLSLNTSVVAQSTWYVDVANTPPGIGTQADPYTSIGFALAHVSTLSGDTLLVAPGLYEETVDFVGKDVLLQSLGAVTIQAPLGTHQVLRFTSGEGQGCVVEGFTIQGAMTLLPASDGGGIYCLNSSPQIIDCTISANVVGGRGAGIYAESSNLVLRDCVIQDNGDIFMTGSGGGIYAFDCVLTIDGGSIANNITEGRGAGLYAEQCALVLRGSLGVTGNTSTRWNGGGLHFVDCSDVFMFGVELVSNSVFDDRLGGGLYLENSDAFIWRCLFDDNFADGGAGAWIDSGIVDFVRCRFLDNVARANLYAPGGSGGGLGTMNGGQVVVLRSVFAGNQAEAGGLEGDPGRGGGVFGPARLIRCTLEDNFAAVAGGGVWTTSINSSILWNNTPDDVGGPSAVDFSCVGGGYQGTGNIELDPRFFDALARDYRLLLVSPCIDAASPEIGLDADGTLRDMGAFGRVRHVGIGSR